MHDVCRSRVRQLESKRARAVKLEPGDHGAAGAVSIKGSPLAHVLHTHTLIKRTIFLSLQYSNSNKSLRKNTVKREYVQNVKNHVFAQTYPRPSQM